MRVWLPVVLSPLGASVGISSSWEDEGSWGCASATCTGFEATLHLQSFIAGATLQLGETAELTWLSCTPLSSPVSDQQSQRL